MLVPAQYGPAGAAVILTSGAIVGFTVTTTGGEVAVLAVTQVEFDVRVTETTSPSDKVFVI
jgi:uncharacterized membrane protein